ncbi:IS30 family transposase [Psychromonas sp. SP041]|uniref:IS30 family transposase n=1 Tax=Psychromonas sp. SP041 TaxID=1365007 RepID=UPI00041F0B16|nr:IS30 family transposase [Psychromonas sp. SP041]
MNYKQLTQEERYQIYVLIKANHNQKEIAKILGRSASSISRELKRNKDLRGYRPKQAQSLAVKRRVTAAKSVKITDHVKKWIHDLLWKDFTPEQIVGRLALEGKITLHHESVYRYIYQDKASGGTLYKKLTRACKKYKKRYGSYDKYGQLVNPVSIDERPDIVDTKSRIGDWEGDTVIGKGRKNAFVTMVARKTLFTVVKRIESKHADITADALISSMKPLQSHILTIR